ncbi:hypothetical protein [Rhizobacter sp. Root1221]|uniref:hypothetical protein n=1 Tax=Rhizobacter sp. Root1221 TaxID=1736433 RepID=UPI0006FCE9A8|nr:hypothetical protein [Rhizobacter sp. Root1221]
MQLTSVNLDQLSALVHDVKLPPTQRFAVPEFKVLSYKGQYQSRADAIYILATAKAAHEAWYSHGLVIDFGELHYRGGDEMAWVLQVGQQPPLDCPFPLAFVVGPGCEAGLRSLLELGLQRPVTFKEYCTDSLESAVKLVAAKRTAFQHCRDQWLKTPKN